MALTRGYGPNPHEASISHIGFRAARAAVVDRIRAGVTVFRNVDGAGHRLSRGDSVAAGDLLVARMPKAQSGDWFWLRDLD